MLRSKSTYLHDCFVDTGVLSTRQDRHSGVFVAGFLQLTNDLGDLLVGPEMELR